MNFGNLLADHLAKELDIHIDDITRSLELFCTLFVLKKPSRVKSVRYNYKYLQQFCAENSITLKKEYNNVNRDTPIIAKCIELGCENLMVKKSFRELVNNKNFGCIGCSKKIKQQKTKDTNMERYGFTTPMQNEMVKQKLKDTNMEKYGCENPFQNEMIKQKMKETNMKKLGCEYSSQNDGVKQKMKETNMKRLGCEYPLQNDGVKQKSKETNMKKLGCEYPSQNEMVKQKMKDTNIEKYGCKHPLQNEEVKQKVFFTNTEKYGFANPMQNEEVKQKVKDTNMERYGYGCSFQNEEVKQKVKDTNMERYGSIYPMQNEEVKQKGRETNIKIYGYPHPMQNSEFADKVSKNAYKSKNYVYPSGKIDRVQGYEHLALNELLDEGIDENDIITLRSKVPEIWYKDITGKSHRYYVDIYILSQNKCIEAKSTWTAEKKNDNIFLKQQAVIDAGYKCEIWVYNNKGVKVCCY